MLYHSHHDAGPISLRRARTGQGPKLWCTRNSLNGGRSGKVAQQGVHPHDGVHILHLCEDTLYAYLDVPSRAVDLWFLLAAEVSIDSRELGSRFIEQVSLAIHVRRLPLRLFKELGESMKPSAACQCGLTLGPSLPLEDLTLPRQDHNFDCLWVTTGRTVKTRPKIREHKATWALLAPPVCVTVPLISPPPSGTESAWFPSAGKDMATGRQLKAKVSITSQERQRQGPGWTHISKFGAQGPDSG